MSDKEIQATLEQAQRCVAAGSCAGHTMQYANHVGYLFGRVETLEAENERLKQQCDEKNVEVAEWQKAIKTHCQCVFEDSKLVTICHWHACDRFGQDENGDPLQAQLTEPIDCQSDPPIDLLRKENERLKSALTGAWLNYDAIPYQLATEEYDAMLTAELSIPLNMPSPKDDDMFAVQNIYQMKSEDIEVVMREGYQNYNLAEANRNQPMTEPSKAAKTEPTVVEPPYKCSRCGVGLFESGYLRNGLCLNCRLQDDWWTV